MTTNPSSSVTVRNSYAKASRSALFFFFVSLSLAAASLVASVLWQEAAMDYLPIGATFSAIGIVSYAASAFLRATSQKKARAGFESATGLHMREQSEDRLHVTATNDHGVSSVWLLNITNDETVFSYRGILTHNQSSISGFEFRPDEISGSIREQNESFKTQIEGAFLRHGLTLVSAPDIRLASQSLIMQDTSDEHTLYRWTVSYFASQQRISCLPASFNGFASHSLTI